MFKTVTAALLAATAAAGAASAGSPIPASPDPVITAPPAMAPAAVDWSGGYVGGQIGLGYGDFSLNPNDFSDNSVIGGLNAGYLWSLGNGWYLGPELQYDRANLTITDSGTGNTASFKEMARLKLIAGHEMGERGLLYGSAGFAYGSVDGVNTFIDGSDGSYTVGLGYDYMINDNWSAGVEYQYADFNDIGNNGGDVGVNTLQAKFDYRF